MGLWLSPCMHVFLVFYPVILKLVQIYFVFPDTIKQFLAVILAAEQ